MSGVAGGVRGCMVDDAAGSAFAVATRMENCFFSDRGVRILLSSNCTVSRAVSGVPAGTLIVRPSSRRGGNSQFPPPASTPAFSRAPSGMPVMLTRAFSFACSGLTFIASGEGRPDITRTSEAAIMGAVSEGDTTAAAFDTSKSVPFLIHRPYPGELLSGVWFVAPGPGGRLGHRN